MEFQRFDTRYQLRLESGEGLNATLVPWLKNRRISYAAVTGLGAIGSASLRFYRPEIKGYEDHRFDEQFEVVSLVGNVTLREGEPFIHAHATLARRDLSMIGGHVDELIAQPLLEVWLAPEDATVYRTLDESCGLYVMQLPERP
jgi:predicted DNA-binding protein with PD1-like motif